MQITLYDVSGSETILEGTDESGNVFRVRGYLRFSEQSTDFVDGTIVHGPPFLCGQPCMAHIIDTIAVLTLLKTIQPGYQSVRHMHNTQL